jgi:hypothetical protein
MRTLRVVNGDFSVNPGTGKIAYVDKIEKASQDVARHIMSEFDLFFQEGNELINTRNPLTEPLVVQYLTESVNRLIIKQQVADAENRIIKVNKILVDLVGLTTLVFLVEVLYSDGGLASVVDTINMKKTELNHRLDPNTFLEGDIGG